MNRLDKSINKLNRIRKAKEQAFSKGLEESKKIPFGQPNIIGRSDIYKCAKRQWAKAEKLQQEEIKQLNQVEKLEKIEHFKNDNELIKDVHVVGKSSYATVGAKTSVNNLDYFKNKLLELESKNIKAKEYNKKRDKSKPKAITYGAEITKLKNKITYLESMQDQSIKNDNIMNEKTKELIETGAVRQWKKKPIYYFVDGLQKVAFEINESGEFITSNRYPAKDEKDQQFINELLK